MILGSRFGEPPDDSRRLGALADTGLLDAPPPGGLQRIARLAARLLPAPVALVSLVDARHQYTVASTDFDVHPFPSLHERPPTHAFCQRVVLTGRPLRVTDARSYLGVPLRSSDGHVLGSLCAIDDKLRRWTADDEDALGDLAALARDELRSRRTGAKDAELTHRLQDEIRRDRLTGLLNRPHWLERAPLALARASREDRPASAVVIDLDGFRIINDEHGLAAGDALLAALGDLWSPLLRTPDLFARWGGDEFALLLYDADAAQARRIADRLAAAAEPWIDLSFGVAEWDRHEPVGALLARAGRQLLEARRRITGLGQPARSPLDGGRRTS